MSSALKEGNLLPDSPSNKAGELPDLGRQEI
jgi:hypothetical protein